MVGTAVAVGGTGVGGAAVGGGGLVAVGGGGGVAVAVGGGVLVAVAVGRGGMVPATGTASLSNGSTGRVTLAASQARRPPGSSTRYQSPRRERAIISTRSPCRNVPTVPNIVPGPLRRLTEASVTSSWSRCSAVVALSSRVGVGVELGMDVEVAEAEGTAVAVVVAVGVSVTTIITATSVSIVASVMGCSVTPLSPPKAHQRPPISNKRSKKIPPTQCQTGRRWTGGAGAGVGGTISVTGGVAGGGGRLVGASGDGGIVARGTVVVAVGDSWFWSGCVRARAISLAVAKR
jgi:hypothetical protein